MMKCKNCKVGDLILDGSTYVCPNCGAAYAQGYMENAIKEGESRKKTEKINLPLTTDKYSNRYTVEVNSNYLLPRKCTCCLSDDCTTTEVHAYSATQNASWRKRYQLTAKMSLCNECKEHEEKAKQLAYKTQKICVVLGAAIHLFSFILYKNASRPGEMQASILFLPMIYGILSTYLLYIIASSLIKLPALTINHSSRINSVVLSSGDMPMGHESFRSMNQKKSINTISFTFTNAEYGTMFQELNAFSLLGIKCERKRNTAAKTSLLVNTGDWNRMTSLCLLVNFSMWFILLFIALQK